jgi:hypothetical protein
MSPRLLLLSVVLLTACAESSERILAPVAPGAGYADANGARGPTVMIRNMYLGADLNPLLEAPSAGDVPFIAADIWNRIQASNPPARAGLMAEEIAGAAPDLVGLQEAVLFQIQSPGDAAFGGAVPATSVAYDFVGLLLDSLTARGVSYVVASEAIGTVIELPVFTGAQPVPFDDVRFTDREVILARVDVAVGNAQSGIFAAGIDLPIGGPGGPLLSQRRGWASIDATIRGHEFRFLSTHLEIQAAAPIQEAQAAELIAIANGAPLPVVLGGDINSAADGSQTQSYASIMAAGFEDAWQRQGASGYTCCHDEDLLNVHPGLDQRIDIIFVRGFRSTPRGSIGAQVQLTGDHVNDRLPAGLWPSDHAGVIASLRLTPPAVAVE